MTSDPKDAERLAQIREAWPGPERNDLGPLGNVVPFLLRLIEERTQELDEARRSAEELAAESEEESGACGWWAAKCHQFFDELTLLRRVTQPDAGVAPSFSEALAEASTRPVDDELRRVCRAYLDSQRDTQSSADDVERARDDLVRIWSGEHEAYWRPNAQGYTVRAAAAWILPRAEAESRTAHCGPEKMIDIQEASDITAARREERQLRALDEAARKCTLSDFIHHDTAATDRGVVLFFETHEDADAFLTAFVALAARDAGLTDGEGRR